jgi:fructose/tagatose bisphosphate aldolase
LFNESPRLPAVHEALAEGFNLVMYSEEGLSRDELAGRVRNLSEAAHAAGAAVEAEMAALPGVAGDLPTSPRRSPLTDPAAAARFVEATLVDALAVNVGQAHLHGRRFARLDLDRLARIRARVAAPLVLHAGSSIAPDDLRAAVRLGVRKVNFASAQKQAWLRAVREACARIDADANPYAAVGSGLPDDVLAAGRLAVRACVEALIPLLGSGGTG